MPELIWRQPTEADRAHVCHARNPYEPGGFTVAWNAEYRCWALADALHILVAVSEILAPKEDQS